MSTKHNVLLSLGGQSGTLVLSLIAAVITARWLGPSGRGVLSMTASGAYVGAALLSLGLGTGLTTLVARRSLDVRSAGLISFAAVIIALVIAQVGTAAVASLIRADQIVVARWLPLAITATLLSMLQTSVAVGSANFKSSVANAAVTGVLQVSCYLVAARTGNSFAGIAIAIWIVAQGAGAVVGWTMLLRPAPPARTEVRPLAQDMVRLSLAAFPGLIFGMANLRLDVFLLGFWSSSTQVGLYSMAALGVTALAIAPSAIGQALTSRFGAPEVDPHAYLRRGMMLAFVAATGLGILAAAVGWFVVPLILGPAYRGTVPMLYALIPGFVLFSTCLVSSSYVNVVLGRPWMGGRVVGLAVVVDVALLALLAPRAGGMGAAIASSIAYACAAALNTFQLRGVLFRHTLPAISPDALKPHTVTSAGAADE